MQVLVKVGEAAAKCLSSFRKDIAGATAVEFGLLATMLLLTLIPVTDLSMAIRAKQQVSNAARVGAEYAAINGFNSSTISSAVTAATTRSVTVNSTTYCGCASSSGIAQQACGTVCPSGRSAATYASITATTNYSPLFPNRWIGRLINNVIGLTTTEVTRII